MDMRNVWAESRRVRREEVLWERNDHTRRVSHDGESDNRARSRSAQSRRYMFGTPGPTACRRQAAHWGDFSHPVLSGYRTGIRRDEVRRVSDRSRMT